MDVVGSGVFVFAAEVIARGTQRQAVSKLDTGRYQMARDFAEHFYASVAWKQVRAAYRKKAGMMCERCLTSPGQIVHHKIALTPQNITDPRIALGEDNLELVCRNCHAEAHGTVKRFHVDAFGRVTAAETSPLSRGKGGH